jgi:hypothetical protein
MKTAKVSDRIELHGTMKESVVNIKMEDKEQKSFIQIDRYEAIDLIKELKDWFGLEGEKK